MERFEFEVGKTYVDTEWYGCGYDAGKYEIKFEIVDKTPTKIKYICYNDAEDKVRTSKLSSVYHDYSDTESECFNLHYVVECGYGDDKRSRFVFAQYVGVLNKGE